MTSGRVTPARSAVDSGQARGHGGCSPSPGRFFATALRRYRARPPVSARISLFGFDSAQEGLCHGEMLSALAGPFEKRSGLPFPVDATFRTGTTSRVLPELEAGTHLCGSALASARRERRAAA